MFTLHQLRIFQTTARVGSITKAAEQLYLTQPAVSQHIHSLEVTLGVKLFKRGRKGVAVTPAGKVLQAYSRCLLCLAEQTTQAVRQAIAVKEKHLTLGASPGIGTSLLPDMLQTFYKRYPTVTVTLRTDTTPVIAEALLKGDVDLGVVEGEIVKEGIKVIPLWDEEILVVVGPGHRWWGKRHISVQALAKEKFVGRENDSLTLIWCRSTLARYGITPHLIAQFDMPASIKEAVSAGLGIALLPRFLIQHELGAGRLHALQLKEGQLSRTMKLLWASTGLRKPSVHIFLEYLMSEFPDLPIHLSRDLHLSPLQRRWLQQEEDTGVMMPLPDIERCCQAG